MGARALAEQYLQYSHEQPGDPDVYEALRQRGIDLVATMAEQCPPGEKLNKAINLVFDSVYQAQRAIAEERLPRVNPPSLVVRDDESLPTELYA